MTVTTVPLIMISFNSIPFRYHTTINSNLFISLYHTIIQPYYSNLHLWSIIHKHHYNSQYNISSFSHSNVIFSVIIITVKYNTIINVLYYYYDYTIHLIKSHIVLHIQIPHIIHLLNYITITLYIIIPICIDYYHHPSSITMLL